MDRSFAQTREWVAGHWLWGAEDIEDALQGVKRCPDPEQGPSGIDIRPLYEAVDVR